MDYVYITLVADTNKADLKVLAFVTISELLDMLSEASAQLGFVIGKDSRIQAEPLGRILDNEKTLEEEGVTQGSILTVV